jgi:drug/metabolite transporter (DMT)-like permease
LHHDALLKGRELGYSCAAITLLIWSSFPVVSKLGGSGGLTIYDITALRVGLAALALAPWWVPRLLKPGLRRLKWYQTLTFSALAGVAYPLLAFGGVQFAPASHGAVLVVGMLPLFTTLLAYLALGELPGRVRVWSLCLILAGVVLILGSNLLRFGLSMVVLKGDLILLAASLVWASFTVLLKVWKVRAFDVTLAAVAVAFLIYLPIYMLWLPKGLVNAPLQQIGIQAVFQGLIVPCVAMFTYAKSTELLGSTKVVVMLSATPVVGTLLSVAFLAEQLHPGVAVGAMVVFIGAMIGAIDKG